MSHNNPSQQYYAFQQQVKKERWLPQHLDKEFVDTLDIALLQERYGIRNEPDHFRTSKFDLQKLTEMHRRNWELNDHQKRALYSVAQPIDGYETRIWKDRTFKVNEKLRNENMIAARVG